MSKWESLFTSLKMNSLKHIKLYVLRICTKVWNNEYLPQHGIEIERETYNRKDREREKPEMEMFEATKCSCMHCIHFPPISFAKERVCLQIWHHRKTSWWNRKRLAARANKMREFAPILRERKERYIPRYISIVVLTYEVGEMKHVCHNNLPLVVERAQSLRKSRLIIIWGAIWECDLCVRKGMRQHIDVSPKAAAACRLRLSCLCFLSTAKEAVEKKIPPLLIFNTTPHPMLI